MSLLSRLAVQAARAYGILSSADKTKVVADYLVVAGGGGADFGYTGGGGAGGYQTSTTSLSTLNTYSITVGAGGVAGVSGGASSTNGANSVVSGTGLSTITSIGGGRSVNAGNGVSGGSGGGGGNNTGFLTGGSGTSGQGNAGGNGAYGGGNGYTTGGGGGAGAVGSNGNGTNQSGNGGAGSASSISGSSVTYAGGGGGGGYSPFSVTNGSGGTGGGGAGGYTSGQAGTAGTANLGGGGGGGAGGNGSGGAGGSGIVIISYTSATPKFVGGTLTTSGGKQIHTFTSSGTLSPITPITADFLVVAGGGSGGSGTAGGGGAGGFRTSAGTSGGGASAEAKLTLYSGASYVVTVGGGGAGGTTPSTATNNGSNSSISGTGITTVTSTGGGNGGGTQGGSSRAAGNGGSGGGGASDGSLVTAAGTGTSGQGYAGGSTSSGFNNSAGGGGAGAVGSSPTVTQTGAAGGVGVASSISGSSVYYAGGGGGGGGTGGGGAGGNGGGGAGSASGGGSGTAGTANTGGGGGGSWNWSGSGFGSGGSGIVIISYAGSQVFNGGLVTSSGGNTIHTFTSTGALTPLTNNLTNSLRFRSSASAFLSRTFASTGTNNKIQTFSAWVKRGLLSSSANYRLMGCYNGSSSYSTEINFSNDSFRIEFGGSAAYELKTTQVFRDPSAWYHFVIAIDTTQATAANRIKMYVNGNQITAFATANYPAQNDSSQLGSATANNKIGANWNTSGAAEYFDGYMTDINFIDGQALEPYYFGNNDANGVWKPILYKGTYGTNGFYLTFGNTTSTTTLGYDSSPNGNNWTTNNISLTAGTTYDAMTDVPTNTSATVANYAVVSPIDISSVGATISNGNLRFNNGSGGSQSTARATIGVSSGKYYWETTCTTFGGSNPDTGILGTNSSLSSADQYVGNYALGYSYGGNGQKRNNNSGSAYGASYTSGDVIGVALDMDAGTLTFYKNNTSQGTAFTGLSGTFSPAISGYNGVVWDVNFGQRPFAYTPPTGFVRLNTYNLPTPTILQGNKYMDATLYTGRAAAQVIVNQAQFKPDFVWVKNRSHNDADPYYGVHLLFNSTTGVGNRLMSQSTAVEAFSSQSLTAFNSNGFSIGTDVAIGYSGDSYVGWQWQAGQGTNTTNTAGTVTSTVSVNATAGFSVVLYTGNGGAMTMGHGLGVAPKLIILKDRDIGRPWPVYHGSLATNQYLILNTTAAAATSTSYWNNTAPTSTVFSVNGLEGNVGASGEKYVAYCWAEIAGFSKFGSFTGNNSLDGPFIYLGFRPSFFMVKRTDVSSDWFMLDDQRPTFNVIGAGNGGQLAANQSYAESTLSSYAIADFLSNGVKVRSDMNYGYWNASGGTYIYAAFAENPFKNANAR